MNETKRNTKFINRVKKSSLLEIIEKSFVTEFGDVKILDKENSVVIEVYTPIQPAKKIARLTFTDFDVKIESQIDFPRDEELIELRFIELMLWVFEDENYQQYWEEYHKNDKFSPEKSS